MAKCRNPDIRFMIYKNYAAVHSRALPGFLERKMMCDKIVIMGMSEKILAYEAANP